MHFLERAIVLVKTMATPIPLSLIGDVCRIIPHCRHSHQVRHMLRRPTWLPPMYMRPTLTPRPRRPVTAGLHCPVKAVSAFSSRPTDATGTSTTGTSTAPASSTPVSSYASSSSTGVAGTSLVTTGPAPASPATQAHSGACVPSLGVVSVSVAAFATPVATAAIVNQFAGTSKPFASAADGAASSTSTSTVDEPVRTLA